MQNDLIQAMTDSFEGHAQQTENGVEYWLARDVQHLLGYSKWDNFLNVISKAKTACELSNHPIADHFADVGKMVELGSGSQREISDITPSPLMSPSLFLKLFQTFLVSLPFFLVSFPRTRESITARI